MAYNEKLADRMREYLVDLKKIEEKKMMGGLCFMYKGKMCCGIVKEDLMVRVIPERHEEALSHPHGRPMDFTGKPLKNFVFVESEGYKRKTDLEYWLEMGIEFVNTLPAKTAKKKLVNKKVKKSMPAKKKTKGTKK